MTQRYLCSTDDGINFDECPTETICAAKDNPEEYDRFLYKVDTEYEYYIENWYSEMDLTCTPETTVSMMFTCYFIGTLVSGFLAPIPDRYGRKKSVFSGLLLSTLSQTFMLFVPSLAARAVCFFLLGFANLKNSQAYVWLSEVVPFERRSCTFTIINIADACTGLVAGIFYVLISRNYMPLYIFVVSLSYLALLLALFMPDSPRWLLITDKEK